MLSQLILIATLSPFAAASSGARLDEAHASAHPAAPAAAPTTAQTSAQAAVKTAPQKSVARAMPTQQKERAKLSATQDSGSPQTAPAKPAQLSAYVQRMMTLDRNRDGFLTPDELPGSLKKLMEHDRNQDKRIGPLELARIESGAIAQRGGTAQGDEQAPQAGGRGGRRGAGPRGNLRNLPQGAAGSPLDPEQVIRFALTFDADHDGGLNAAELRRYAVALAARRARGRRQPGNSGAQPAERPSGADTDGKSGPQQPARGLGAPGTKDDPKNPFGPPG